MKKFGLLQAAGAVVALVGTAGCSSPPTPWVGGGSNVMTWTKGTWVTPSDSQCCATDTGPVTLTFAAAGTFTATFVSTDPGTACVLTETYTGMYTNTTMAMAANVTTGTFTTTGVAATFGIASCTTATSNVATRAMMAGDGSTQITNATYNWSLDQTSSTAPTLDITGGTSSFEGVFTKGS